MSIEKIQEKIQLAVSPLREKTFIYDLLLAYGQPKSTITLLQKGSYNLSKKEDEIIWKKKLHFLKVVQRDLHAVIDEMRSDPSVLRHHPRFIILTDFTTLLAVDTKTNDTLDIPILEIAKHSDFFLPWAGMEKMRYQSESPADIKAAERMGRLYDIILEDNEELNHTAQGKHALNIFLSRLLFCFFAEDTGIFADDQFTSGIASHTVEDGSDLKPYLKKLFKVLNLKERSDYPRFLQAFPYVNGGLFADDYPIPLLSRKSRKIIIECGALDWSAINPDIFGSMMQAVVHHSERANLGMHYTSVVNIMKVIEPLLLNDLKDALEKAEDNENKLIKLLDRLYHLRIFDPACGSGNFLIIVYKALCELEIEIFKRLRELKQLHHIASKWNIAKSGIRLSQFYGIELDDFAHETAMLSLWLAEHQMNLAFKEVFGEARPTLPLQDGGNIACGNATRLDWGKVCPKDGRGEIYILGNPPYLGARVQNKEQKQDVKIVLSHINGYNNLDYIACWFVKAADYIRGSMAQAVFVSTNSISQGEQVSILWPHVLNNLEIGFAYQSFKWTNNAKGNAGVTCAIIGIRGLSGKQKQLFKGSVSLSVKNISPYLVESRSVYVTPRKKLLSKFPMLTFGNMPNDGGNLFLDEAERDDLLEKYHECYPIIRVAKGASEFIKGSNRFCLWIDRTNFELARRISPIAKKIESVKRYRLSSSRAATRLLAKIPYSFAEIRHQDGHSIIIPCHSSERRDYIPIGFLDGQTIILNSAMAIYNSTPDIFAIISSNMHMTWVRAVAGRLETRIRYSAGVCYNTFPFPRISSEQKTSLESYVLKVLDERERHSEKTLAQLYDPDKMPKGLRQAHHEMDVAVEQCYRSKPFNSDEDRLEFLLNLYEEMIEAEKRK